MSSLKMCEYPCVVPLIEKKFRKLTLILLDCWQREYDERPYRNFKFERLTFEEPFGRKYHFLKDFPVIVLFIQKRYINSMKLVGLDLTTYMLQTMYDFVESLKRLKFIELKLMNLPTIFYKELTNNVDHMKLTELSLEGTPLTDEDIVYLRLYVIKSLKLESLNVNSCSITQYNFADIADAVYKSSKVHTFKVSYLLGLHLHLDTQKIAHTVASLLWQNKLQALELENCGFNAQDMELLAEYLYSKSCQLVSLDLAYNKIGANGALKLLKAIAYSSSLKHLNLSGCGLGSHGGEIVAHYLSSCWNLESLILQYNNIEPEIVTMILLCMKKPCKLYKLHLYGNSYNPRTGKILRRLLESRVLPQDYIDITFTYDDTIPGYRVIPWRP